MHSLYEAPMTRILFDADNFYEHATCNMTARITTAIQTITVASFILRHGVVIVLNCNCVVLYSVIIAT